MIEIRRKGCFVELYIDGKRQKCSTDADEIKRYADVASTIKCEPITEAKSKKVGKKRKEKTVIRILESENMFNTKGE